MTWQFDYTPSAITGYTNLPYEGTKVAMLCSPLDEGTEAGVQTITYNGENSGLLLKFFNSDGDPYEYIGSMTVTLFIM
jgi:hypothetical protein